MTGDTAAVFARVEGRVQGVGFRYCCIHEARRLGLAGWVRNTAAGDVEVFAEGRAGALEALLRWLNHGPPGARVDYVHREDAPPQGLRGFDVEV